MIIHLTKSKLFNTHPAERFADEYLVSEKIWNEIWKRYSILDYSTKELCEFYYIKIGRPIGIKLMNKWLFRTHIYSIAKSFMNDGAKTVNSNIFGDLEDRVINEITRHLRYGESKDSVTLA